MIFDVPRLPHDLLRLVTDESACEAITVDPSTCDVASLAWKWTYIAPSRKCATLRLNPTQDALLLRVPSAAVFGQAFASHVCLSLANVDPVIVRFVLAVEAHCKNYMDAYEGAYAGHNRASDFHSAVSPESRLKILTTKPFIALNGANGKVIQTNNDLVPMREATDVLLRFGKLWKLSSGLAGASWHLVSGVFSP